MPQASISFGLTASPLEGAIVQLTYRYYDLYFSDWSPTSREYSDGDTPDRVDIWRIPAYGIVDLNAFYDIPFEKPQLFLNIRNLLDKVYLQDSTDNSR
jgi:outer membrane receptor protein involved in Fe transport